MNISFLAIFSKLLNTLLFASLRPISLSLFHLHNYFISVFHIYCTIFNDLGFTQGNIFQLRERVAKREREFNERKLN